MELNIDQIRAILPHRYPFLLVDRISDYQPGEWARGIKCVSANEPQFTGHFPERSIFPGVLLLEALAQVGAIAVLTQEANRGKLALFAGVKEAKFRRTVIPGDVVELSCRITRIIGSMGIGEATATVNGQTACSAQLMFAIEQA